MYAYPTRSSWAIPVIAAICLLSLNYGETLSHRHPFLFVMFVQQWGYDGQALVNSLTPFDARAAADALLRSVTYQFMHGNLMHFTMNILLLFFFGRRVERYLGGVKFLAFYVLSGTAVALIWTLVEPNISVPLVGASGSISACLGGYVAHVLHTRGKTRLDLTAGIFGLLVAAHLIWSQISAVNSAEAAAMPIAYSAHIIGIVVGYVVVAAVAFVRSRRARIRISPPVRTEA